MAQETSYVDPLPLSEKKAARLQALALDTLRFTGDVPYRFYLSIQQKLRVDMLTVVADLA